MSGGANRFRDLLVRSPERRPLEWLCARAYRREPTTPLLEHAHCTMCERPWVRQMPPFSKHRRRGRECRDNMMWQRAPRSVRDIFIGMYQLPLWGRRLNRVRYSRDCISNSVWVSMWKMRTIIVLRGCRNRLSPSITHGWSGGGPRLNWWANTYRNHLNVQHRLWVNSDYLTVSTVRRDDSKCT